MTLTPERLRRWADELEQEEADAAANLEAAEKAKASEERIARLEAELKSIREEKREADGEVEKLDEQEEQEPADDEVKRKRAARKKAGESEKRTRPGRKHGNVYQDDETGEGYVYGGDDEPDEVEVDDDEEDEVA